MYVNVNQPDVTAPGVNIIASYSEAVSPSEFDYDKRRVPFTTMSGTSMSCPHVAGIVGLVKKVHPDWSPAAIRSAIMTTGKTSLIQSFLFLCLLAKMLRTEQHFVL